MAFLRILQLFLSCVALLLTSLTSSSAQRFVSSQAKAQIQAEMELDGDLGGLSREMFLMKEKKWELLPPILDSLSTNLREHVLEYLNDPVKLSLQTKKGKYGMRAIGKTCSGQKLRAYWRESLPTRAIKVGASDLLEAPYDAACRSRLSMVEFEVQLPPMKKGTGLPSVVYCIAVEPGSMNPKAIVPRGAGKIKIYPEGRESKALEAGPGNIGLSMRAGLVDPVWAKGKSIFRKGRPAGVI